MEIEYNKHIISRRRDATAKIMNRLHFVAPTTNVENTSISIIARRKSRFLKENYSHVLTSALNFIVMRGRESYVLVLSFIRGQLFSVNWRNMGVYDLGMFPPHLSTNTYLYQTLKLKYNKKLLTVFFSFSIYYHRNTPYKYTSIC